MKTKIAIVSGIIFAAILFTGITSSFMFPDLTCPAGTIVKNDVCVIASTDSREETKSESSIQTPTYVEPKTTGSSCDSSYPSVCIPSYPPDLDCGEISYSNFRVLQPDPHGFDTDYDGVGCEVGSQSSEPVKSTQENICDPSYPDVCIAPYPPDLDCGEIGYSNFKVVGSDPHGFDRDNDGIGCES